MKPKIKRISLHYPKGVKTLLVTCGELAGNVTFNDKLFRIFWFKGTKEIFVFEHYWTDDK